MLDNTAAQPFSPGPELGISIRLGAASTETCPPADLMRRADQAMEAMKERH